MRHHQLFENLLSVDDLAGLLQKSPKTIRNWVAQRKIPFLTVGNQTMFLADSILAWLQSKEEQPLCR